MLRLMGILINNKTKVRIQFNHLNNIKDKNIFHKYALLFANNLVKITLISYKFTQILCTNSFQSKLSQLQKGCDHKSKP